MEVTFKNSVLKKLCENHKQLKRVYGSLQSERIIKRINEFVAAENFYDISRLPQARLHPLVGNLKEYWAVDIINQYRILLKPSNGSIEDLLSITQVQIMEIGKEDYHK